MKHMTPRLRIRIYLFYSFSILAFLLTIAVLSRTLSTSQLFIITDSSTPNFDANSGNSMTEFTNESFQNQSNTILDHFNAQNETPADFVVPELSTEPTLVLIWDTPIWGANELLEEEKLFNGCSPELNCVITKNHSYLEESDAVLIRLRFFTWDQLPVNMTRRSDQYFIMSEWESPGTNQYVDMSNHQDFFNLTMSYRRDSDIVWPFGDFLPIPEDKKKNETELGESLIQLEKVIKGKTKLIAWFASNCYYTSSKRGNFVEDFKKYIQVDAYGACGNLVCPKAHGKWISSKGCHEMLNKDYKFYLSLENSICIDYVTEKFFDMLTTVTIIPVVFKRKLVMDMIKDTEIAAAFNKSFIAIDDFDSLEDLANYLNYLDKNMTAYLEYFEWKSNYQIVFDRTADLPGCQLCRIIKQKKHHVIRNIQNWWYDGGNCQSYVSRIVPELVKKF